MEDKVVIKVVYFNALINSNLISYNNECEGNV